MDDLRTWNIELFRSNFKALEPLKQSLTLIRHRLDIHMQRHLDKLAISRKYELINYVTSVHKCISDMITSVDVMIDNSETYYYEGRFGIIRKTLTCSRISGLEHERSCDDIIEVDNIAINCIVIIDNHDKSK